MKAVSAIAGLVSLALTFAAAPARACSCEKLGYDKVLAQTPVVFDGEVLRAEIDTHGVNEITSFRVRGVVKGLSPKLVTTLDSVMKRRPQRTVTVISPVDESNCGYDFSTGPQRLIVGAVRSPEGTLIASRCTILNLNSTLLEERK
jgi:hypothetical protein